MILAKMMASGRRASCSRMDTRGQAAEDSHSRRKSEDGARPKGACRREWRETV